MTNTAMTTSHRPSTQLRYVERTVATPEIAKNSMRTVRVLQQMFLPNDWNTHSEEWRDVPIWDGEPHPKPALINPSARSAMMDDLNTVVRVMWGTGERRGFGRVIAVCDAPTFTLEMDTGEKITWRQDLCRGAQPAEEVAYWKARALAAEKSNADLTGATAPRI
jgi:hypothetical protein